MKKRLYQYWTMCGQLIFCYEAISVAMADLAFQQIRGYPAIQSEVDIFIQDGITSYWLYGQNRVFN